MDIKKMKERQEQIRDLPIIARIGYGKSTLADRISEMTHTVTSREMQDQLLDPMGLERERRATIKLNVVELNYTAKNREAYIFHLIGTPGHAGFTCEVSRSPATCGSAVLVVDVAQGIGAQAPANAYLVLDNNLEIPSVINEIDLPVANPKHVRQEIEDIIGISASGVVLASTKSGTGIEDILEQVMEYVPAPNGDLNAPLKALIFDSIYDNYRGVVLNVRITDGIVKPGDKIRLMSNDKTLDVIEVGVFSPKAAARDFLVADDVGYTTTDIKTVQDTRVGDIITLADNPVAGVSSGYRKMNPMVYCGFYPIDTSRYNDLREALEKLQLNDAALQFGPETSQASDFGLRRGFLELLHMDVVQGHLEREFNLELITTTPSVIYHVSKTDGTAAIVDNLADSPESVAIQDVEKSFVKAQIMVPSDFVDAVMKLFQRKQGELITMDYLDDYRVNVVYNILLSEIVLDFFDELKSSTKGYALLDYEMSDYQKNKLAEIDISLNGEKVDTLSSIVHRDFAYERGKAIVEKLEKPIPHQQSEVPIQTVIGQKTVARSDIRALCKNVLVRCYGGDVPRKHKLLEKQRGGKKRTKQIDSIEVPQEAFMVVLKMDEDEPKKQQGFVWK